MAGHNIANIVKGYVEEGKRPDYLRWEADEVDDEGEAGEVVMEEP
jgi:hypothetical protein